MPDWREILADALVNAQQDGIELDDILEEIEYQVSLLEDGY